MWCVCKTLLSLCPCSFRYEHAVLPGCAEDAAVTSACPAGHHSEKEVCALLGGPGPPHLAAVPQDGWQGIVW